MARDTLDARTLVVGWDIGGAHVKACLLQTGDGAGVIDVAQWACPLWRGLDQLAQVLASAQARWPGLAQAQHAVTMTGEMVDLFAHREDGVAQIAATLARTLGVEPRLYAGDAGWCSVAQAGREWAHIASANWLTTAHHAARELSASIAHGVSEGLLVDIGSTTTDLIAFGHGRVLTRARSDVERLATGELVYQGVVRTPLCALSHRIDHQGRSLNVMNEFFATVADVYRLTGELREAHDLYPSADNAAKDPHATRQRLARMIGLDARDASEADWLACAQAWRQAQVDELRGQLQRVMSLHALPANAVIVSAGCGDFLVPDLIQPNGLRPRLMSYGRDLIELGANPLCEPDTLSAWAQVCAPSVAVATLFARDHL